MLSQQQQQRTTHWEERSSGNVFFHNIPERSLSFLSFSFERVEIREMKAKSDKYIQHLPHQIPRWWTDTCLWTCLCMCVKERERACHSTQLLYKQSQKGWGGLFPAPASLKWMALSSPCRLLLFTHKPLCLSHAMKKTCRPPHKHSNPQTTNACVNTHTEIIHKIWGPLLVLATWWSMQGL